MNKEPGVPAKREPIARPLEWLILGLLILNGIGLVVTFGQSASIAKTQDDGTIRGYKNRAVICDMIKGLGITEPTNCADPAIKTYRDPKVRKASTAGATASQHTLEVLCWVLQQSTKQPDSKLVLPPNLCQE